MRAIALQRLMGHTDISITMNTYTSVFNKYKESELTKVNDYYISNSFFETDNLLQENNNLIKNINYENANKESEEELER